MNDPTVRGWAARHWSRLIAGAALATVAAVTGRVSYIHIKALTLALHQPMQVAAIMAFGVDGLVVVGGVVLLQAGPGQAWLGWLCIIPGVAASVFANWESAAQWGPKAAGWATVPAISFAVATFAFERWLRWQVSADGQASPARPVTIEEALAGLVASGSRRAVAAVAGVEPGQVQKWERWLAAEAPGQVPATAGSNGNGPA